MRTTSTCSLRRASARATSSCLKSANTTHTNPWPRLLERSCVRANGVDSHARVKSAAVGHTLQSLFLRSAICSLALSLQLGLCQIRGKAMRRSYPERTAVNEMQTARLFGCPHVPNEKYKMMYPNPPLLPHEPPALLFHALLFPRAGTRHIQSGYKAATFCQGQTRHSKLDAPPSACAAPSRPAPEQPAPPALHGLCTQNSRTYSRKIKEACCR
jgi:hypothetical protein